MNEVCENFCLRNSSLFLDGSQSCKGLSWYLQESHRISPSRQVYRSWGQPTRRAFWAICYPNASFLTRMSIYHFVDNSPEEDAILSEVQCTEPRRFGTRFDQDLYHLLFWHQSRICLAGKLLPLISLHCRRTNNSSWNSHSRRCKCWLPSHRWTIAWRIFVL